MVVVERKKRIHIGLIILFLITGLTLAANLPTILNSTNQFIVQKTKIETTVTKTITPKGIMSLTSKQTKLARKYGEHRAWKTQWLSKEIRDGKDTLFSLYISIDDHSKLLDSAKIKLSFTKYKVDGKTVEFVSNAQILQVHSEDGWEDY
ncbi:hypothetical protein [Peribacillus acanthi]|uniref:hypothetical protein n=1 Tax=Peribacillus acanthi TaxID=2171554 RepID=UPI000D3E8A41|nr:hypothetical protein [Peribacillus acanthi]